MKERMALVADLWGAGLRAEMMQQAAPSLTAQYEYAHLRHIPWLLIIHGATLSAADTVKVWPLCLLLLHYDLAAAVVLATSDPVHISHTASCHYTHVMSAVLMASHRAACHLILFYDRTEQNVFHPGLKV